MPSAFEKYAKIKVPRYTSYPTAPHFSTHLSAATYREWLARLDPDEPISLYLHVPFCKQQWLVLRLQHEACGALFTRRRLCPTSA
jgi:hypothetical protein